MPRYHVIKTNMTGGEFSPLLEGRVDIDQYTNAVKELKNFLIMPYGGVTRRGGWHYVDDTKDHSKKSRLIPFQYSKSLIIFLSLSTSSSDSVVGWEEIFLVAGDPPPSKL